MFPLAALILGLLGSLHCVGMCGPIALALPLRRDRAGAALGGVMLYNTGRALTYAVMGAVTGLAGSAVQWFGGQQVLSIVAGALVLVILAAGFFGKRIKAPFLVKPLAAVRSSLGRLFSRRRADTMLFIGLLNGLLPCGLVYAGLAGAAATGSALQGAIFMFVFGLGTIPALAALSFAGNRISASFREKLRRVVPYFVAVMALMLVLRGLGLGIPYLSPAITEGKTVCCHHHCK
jgi:uncharacterized protein